MKKLIIGITAEGSVNLLLGQLAHFKSMGYDTYLLAPYSERSAAFCKKEGCKHLVISIEREISPLKDLVTFFQILSLFRKVKPDIVNLGTPKVALLGMMAAYVLRIEKRIYTCRGFRFEHEKGFKRKLLMRMERMTAFCSHHIICISSSVKKLGVENQLFAASKAQVIHKGSSNGVNLELFSNENPTYRLKSDELRNALALQNTFVFGFVGRVVDRKGINELFAVFTKLYSEDTSVRLVIVGPFESDQISDKTLVDQMENHPGIIVLGKVAQDEVPIYMQLFNVFVLPAWWEGFGNVLVQAAAMGVPVISTTGTGTVDAVVHDYNGYLVPPKSEKELYAAMKDLLVNRAKATAWGANGIQWAKNFDRTIIWEGMNELYGKK